MIRLVMACCLLAWLPLAADDAPVPDPGVQLIGFAMLPADEFAGGPVSGQFIEAANGRSVPFNRGQPIQGFSAVLDNGDGSFWFGDEFGPWMLHTDAQGKLLEPPIGLPGVMSPDNPGLGHDKPLARSSGGFEGMALGAEGKLLYPMLEKPLQTGSGHLSIFVFDPAQRRFLQEKPGEAWLYYPLDEGSTAIGALTSYGDSSLLVIERDSGEGTAARIKRIYLVDADNRDEQGVMRKKLVVDLLNIADPAGLGGGDSGRFSFPFWTIEGLVVLNESTLGVLNDNNYPFGLGRHPKTGAPDDNEFILLRIPTLGD